MIHLFPRSCLPDGRVVHSLGFVDGVRRFLLHEAGRGVGRWWLVEMEAVGEPVAQVERDLFGFGVWQEVRAMRPAALVIELPATTAHTLLGDAPKGQIHNGGLLHDAIYLSHPNCRCALVDENDDNE